MYRCGTALNRGARVEEAESSIPTHVRSISKHSHSRLALPSFSHFLSLLGFFCLSIRLSNLKILI
jgi:hypothetical protein